MLDLVAAALRAGAPLVLALSCVAPSAPESLQPSLDRVDALLRLGAPPEEAWSDAPRELEPLALVAIRSADSGVRLADGLERQAQSLRERLRADDVARAQRVGVFALLPLGLCFLPAFVLIGIVPVVIGIAGDVLTGVTR